MAALQCEICGGKLIGKPGGVFECDSCGMEYSSAWAKAKIQEIRGTVKVDGSVEVHGEVRVQGTDTIDSLIKKGKTYLELKNYSYAEQVYLTITKKYPEDYRGWWGLIVCKTSGFTTVLRDRTSLNTWFKYVERLTPREKITDLENRYADYTWKASLYAADDQIRRAQDAITTSTNEINTAKSRISYLKNEKNRTLNDRISSLSQSIQDNKAIIARMDEAKSKDRTRRRIATIFVFIHVLVFLFLFIHGGSNDSLGEVGIGFGVLILGAVPFFIAAAPIKLSDTASMERYCAETGLQHDQPEYIRRVAELAAAVAEDKKVIQEHMRTIQKHEDEIESNKCFLGQGKDAIAADWFRKECSECGINDSVVERYLEQ